MKRGFIKKLEREVLILEVVREICFDILKGLRVFIEVEEVEELLRLFKEYGNFYIKICFSNRSFGLGVVRVVGFILVFFKD